MFFLFNDTATTESYTLSLHDALPICGVEHARGRGLRGEATRRIQVDDAAPQGAHDAPAAGVGAGRQGERDDDDHPDRDVRRSEEHTSELQSRQYLVCRLLLEKKNLSV